MQQVLQNSEFGKLSIPSITTHSTGILNCHQLPSVRTFYFKVQIHLYVLKRCFAPLGSAHTDLFTTPIYVKYPNDNIFHTSPGNCSPASNSSVSVITVSYWRLTKCHTFGYINSMPLVTNHSNHVSQHVKS